MLGAERLVYVWFEDYCFNFTWRGVKALQILDPFPGLFGLGNLLQKGRLNVLIV